MKIWPKGKPTAKETIFWAIKSLAKALLRTIDLRQEKKMIVTMRKKPIKISYL